ncbi:MAG: TonB-dependent receptor, partial [Bryobacteraceae bacterium]
YNHAEKIVAKALTNDKGLFGFDSLPPDNYSIRVSLASFVPAVKRGILVQPGMRSFLSVNLAGLFSSVELVYALPGQGALLSDEWKWVLRSSVATRSIMHIGDSSRVKVASEKPAKLFSGTKAMVKVSAGDQGLSSALGQETDLGTAFALATSTYGNNRVQFTGNVGYGSASGIPSAGFSTRFSPMEPNSFAPEVQVTMRQVFLPTRIGASLIGNRQDAPALRSISLVSHDQIQISDNLLLEYGGGLESVSYLERLNYLSPFARATYDLGPGGRLQFGYNSGAPPLPLMTDSAVTDSTLQEGISSLALFPRISLRDGRAAVQRTTNFEMGYRKVTGKRVYSLGAYQETMSNAALSVAGGNGLFSNSDLLPDISSHSSIFNVGTFHSRGFTGSVTQQLGSAWTATLAYGNGGVLRTEARRLVSDDPEELRNMVRSAQQQWASVKLGGSIRETGTRLRASYMWTDYRSLTPAHMYITQSLYPEAGLNIGIRQPIPYPGGFLGRLEASAELRNLLAQGYLPIDTADGGRLVLIHSPRAVRGGLSFIF